ncbi:MAG: FAD:protein FMN transferase [Thermodesulfobacteriota bacterium]
MSEQSYPGGEYEPITRRGFLKLSGILGLGLAGLPAGASLAEAVRFNRQLYKVSISRPEMGTIVSMTLFNDSKDQAHEAVELAFKEIARLSKLMSRYDSDTPVFQLNREGLITEVPPELTFVVKKSLEYHKNSNGVFDITVKPLIDAFKDLAQGPNGLSGCEEKIRKLLPLVDARGIIMAGNSIGFRKAGMGITLDGIAKGYIVDKAMSVLQSNGVQNALINAGGDIRTIGTKGDHSPWRIAIEDPHKKHNYPDIITVKNSAIATSGNYEVFFDREKIHHHIVNPQTGLSPLMNGSVSVQAATTMEADALSTTVFTLDPMTGLKMIKSRPHCEGLIVTRNNIKIKSPGWKSLSV